MPEPIQPVSRVPVNRVRILNDRAVEAGADYVLYWMIAFRRTEWNFALERAADWARSLGLPLLVLEALRADYRWASARLHGFVLDGMADNARALAGRNAAYYPYVEPAAGAGRGLLAALARRAAVVVTDDFPGFFLPRMTEAAAAQVPVRMERVDSNGLLPLAAADRVFPTAYAFRRFLQRALPDHLGDLPRRDALGSGALPTSPTLPSGVTRRFPPPTPAELDDPARRRRLIAGLPVDHTVGPTDLRGGRRAALAGLKRFIGDRLPRYADERNQPELQVTSGLSSYLHFGHVSAHEVFRAVAQAESWTPADLAPGASGSRTGWWGMGPSAEGFLDQLVTWRELGFNMSSRTTDCEAFESLPAWARRTLEEHAGDPREHVYSLDEFAGSRTHDELWNAAQRQLVREGLIHNYLRMLWGKKILEWTASPRQALDVMLELNNRYALDGRNPNSTSGIFWVLGRYDRAWGPERPVYGKIRYMTSANTARKVRVREYLKRHGPQAGLADLRRND